jgi:hypothetical protein
LTADADMDSRIVTLNLFDPEIGRKRLNSHPGRHASDIHFDRLHHSTYARTAWRACVVGAATAFDVLAF